MEVGQFVNEARNNMNDVFMKKYGKDWKLIIYNSVPSDVNKESIYAWLYHNDGFRI